ncbi:MAG: hypothetical protein RL536_542 [Candidatus Parcubacteria bacterium]|jgi:dihydrofolate synthase/folylpolyglutamate synthase
MFSEYHKAVAFVESFSNSSIRKNTGNKKRDPSFFLERTKYFLRLIGNPDKGFQYIHVTGTAGKGTVSTMLQEILTASGKKTGVFTSPYVVTTIEKIRIDQKYISPGAFVRIVSKLKPYIRKAQSSPLGGPSAFELLLAIALTYFQEQKCQWVVLEVGMGGRYDATNIITKPAVTAITNVDYDHTEILGNTLKEIATDKAGIIKRGSAFFTSEQRPQIQKIFKKICAEKAASYFVVKKQKSHNDYNCELARAISRHLNISEAYICKGISNTKLPCRFEIIQRKPLVILDGAHNRAKIRSTASNVKKMNFDRLFLVMAIADTKKDKAAIMQPLLQLHHKMHVILTRVSSTERRTVYPALLAKTAKKYAHKGTILEIVENHSEALKKAMELAKNNDLILVTGSFFLAGEMRKFWVPEEQVLRKRSMN